MTELINTNDMQLKSVMDLWTRLIGDPPIEKQFLFWLEAYGLEITRAGILRTAERNLYMNGKMTEPDRVKFASLAMKQDAAKTQVSNPIVGVHEQQ
jgi:hypothetical protein